MKKLLKSILALTMSLSLVGFPFTSKNYEVQADETGTTYYVSSIHGNDSNDGTSMDTPFQSLNKINELTLGPGDEVLLECGSIFNDQYIHVEGSGSEDAPIIISSYGEGSMPIINTNAKGIWYQDYGITLDDPTHKNRGNVSSSILLYDVEYIEISNLEITNSGADPDGLVYNHINYMNRTGIAAVAQNIGTVDHIVISNCNIHDVYGNVYDKHMNNGGIYFTCFLPANESETGISRYNDVLIENNILDTVNRWGIAVGYTAYHGQFTTAELKDETVIKYGSTNVIVRNNYLNEVGGDAITMMYCYEPLVEYNVAEGTARHINDTDYANSWRGQVAASIWAWKCKDCILQYNEVYDTYLNPDGQAWDADWGDGTLYQYNYSHNNLGGCYMICGVQAINSIFRYNISYLDKQDVLDLQNNPNGEIYNNTFIMDPDTKVVGMSGGRDTKVYNNIFYHTGAEAKTEDWFPDTTSVDYESNLYYNYTSTPGNDAFPVTKDPLFANLNTAPTAYSGLNATEDMIAYSHEMDGPFNGFRLLANSPAINAGTYIADNGGYDFFGNIVVSTPDIGAYDSQTASLYVYSEVYEVSDVMGISKIPQGTTVGQLYNNIVYDCDSIKVMNGEEELGMNDEIVTGSELILTVNGKTKSYPLEIEVVQKEALQMLLQEAKAYNAKDYTEDTFAVLTKAISDAMEVYENNASTQSQVNDAKDALQNAINQLVIYIDEGNLINTEANKANVTVLNYSSQCTSSMEGTGLGTANASLDYNNQTYWHSDWNNEANKVMPQYVTYDLGKAYYVSDIKFLPRQNGNYINGDIFGVNIYVSMDTTFEDSEKVGTYTYDQNDGINLISRDYHFANIANPTQGRYVKFEVTASGSHEGLNLFASMAEIRFYGDEEAPVVPSVDKTVLEKLIIDAQAIDKSLYTEESVATLESAIASAEAVNAKADTTQEEVNGVVEALKAAIAALEEKPVTPSVIKDHLKEAIDTAEALNAKLFTEDSFAAVTSALTAAKAVYANENATQDEVNAAKLALDEAFANLKVKPNEPIVPTMDFYDVQDKTAWFYGSVEKAFIKGLMLATGKAPVDGKSWFEPDTNISRAMVATVLYRMAGQPKVEFKATFKDVTDAKLWYSTAITWAAQNGVVSGYKDGRFGCDDNITRQDLAIMLRNYAKSAGLDTNVTVDFAAFKDGKQVVDYAQSAVAWCVEAKLMSGSQKADGTYLMPTANATRAECAKMFSLLDDAIKANTK